MNLIFIFIFIIYIFNILNVNFLKCGKTLCLKCYEKMIDTNSKCFFKNDHHHIGQTKIINRVLLDSIIEDDKTKPPKKESNSIFNTILL